MIEFIRVYGLDVVAVLLVSAGVSERQRKAALIAAGIALGIFSIFSDPRMLAH